MRRMFLCGFVPLAVWLSMNLLGWGPDAQVLSGTLDAVDPVASTVRGLLFVATWLVVAVTGPPLIGGSLLWWGWGRLDGATPRARPPTRAR